MKLLIDGDVLAYRAGFATEKTKYLVVHSLPNTLLTATYCEDSKTAKDEVTKLGGEVWLRKEAEPEDKALMIVDVMIGDIRARYDAGKADCVVYLSGIGNFRHSIATRASYKGNRAGSVPPRHLSSIRDHLVTKWGAVLSAGEEADDLIGIASTSNPDAIICSIDKDLKQLPGRHYDFVKKEETIISPKQAVFNFYTQVLTGDSVDNVPGIAGIGPVRAAEILAGAKNPSECWQRTVDAYSKVYPNQGYEFAKEAAKLVFVRRYPNQDWSPIETTSTAPQRKPKASR